MNGFILGTVIGCACCFLGVALGFATAELHGRRQRRSTEKYEIGGKTYFPVKVTRPVMEQFIEAQYERSPETLQSAAGFFALVGGAATKEDQQGYMRAAYEQLSVLLKDAEGNNPEPDFLGVYLDVGEAVRMAREIMP